jgi:hypothetical protein
VELLRLCQHQNFRLGHNNDGCLQSEMKMKKVIAGCVGVAKSARLGELGVDI